MENVAFESNFIFNELSFDLFTILQTILFAIDEAETGIVFSSAIHVPQSIFDRPTG